MRRSVKTILLLIVLVVIGAAVLRLGHNYFMRTAYPLGYREIVEEEARTQGVDPALVYAVMKAESNFDPDATSHAGARGLMQITPDTFDWLQTKLREGVSYTADDLYTPRVNIRYGCKFLQILQDEYTEQVTALSAYNAGMGTVNRWLCDPSISEDGVELNRIPYPETERYVSAVLRNYQTYRELYEFDEIGGTFHG